MSIVSDIGGSFYSSAFYGEVAHARRGIGMRFIWALTLIAVLLITGYLIFYSETLNKFAGEVPQFASTLPAISIKGGKFSMDKPSPYTLPIGTEKQRVFITVDTNYKMGDLKALRSYMDTNKVIMLITADEFITVKKDSNTLEVHSFSEFKQDITITHGNWMDFANVVAAKGVNFLIVTVFFGSLIGLLIYNLLATFFGALVMKLIAFIARADIEFGAAMRLTAAVRMAHNAIVAAPLMLGGGYIGGGVSWLIWLGYLIFAVTSSKRQAAK